MASSRSNKKPDKAVVGRVLVQIFSARSEPQWLTGIEAAIRMIAPLAVIVGARPWGEWRGAVAANTSVISFVFFEKTGVQRVF